MLSPIRNLPYKICYHLWTLFLFTKADMKTAFIPITSFAVASAPLASLNHLPHVAFWIWIHTLQMDVSNQTVKPEEDEYNKPDRPLPSRRISLPNALILRWTLVPICWLLSAYYSMETLVVSVALSIVTIIYDEMGFATAHWIVHDLLIALLFVSIEVGACLVASANRHALDHIGVLSVLCSGGVLATTFQAQDFRDAVGDGLVGRKTLPIVAPTVARPILVSALFMWTLALGFLWKLSAIPMLAFNCLLLFVGGRFMLLTTIEADRRSFHLYSIWLSIVHLLPAYSRFITSAQTT